jgi:hypothetical protein
VQAVAPIGLRDRERGTLGFTTSLGSARSSSASRPIRAWRWRSMRGEHGRAEARTYVLAQGTARVTEQPSDAMRELVRTQAAIYLGSPREGFFWDRWLRAYYVSRVPVDVTVARILTWPTLAAAGESQAVLGQPLAPAPVEPQRPPKGGTGPRIDGARAAKRLRATGHTLLGYAGADGRPVVVPVEIGADDESGIALTCATSLPPGGRRAGLLGHSYRPQLIGLTTRQHTGWLEVGEDGGARYAPHTETGYQAPPNKMLLLLLNGALAKKGVRQAAREPKR